ncbi:hypothetical protein AAZX31_06G185400 [Glycine max]|uniref:Transmembrane protein n=2 Tax=Glycine subgen. Soja TaxID=1462606 RepID=I1KCU0_SOYBN|nr:hypothetical protein JHK87_015689 [Glycine soja]KAG5032159.1 hypothetical protein JHK85_016141 [Glycine max]KAG5046367.1 hypothetical protein JHK86_015773 [Glycine max]KAG5148864.1 hypothetical protein JHK82_015745 [Glycine max]KAH1126687.1 hypothetical protein GYH30_015619 [Glycine max]
MKSSLFHLLFVILLGLSHFACLKAVPVTRTESLMQEPKVLHHALDNIHNHKVITGIKWQQEEPSFAERMDLELHDYPPSAANGRHTPKPPYP